MNWIGRGIWIALMVMCAAAPVRAVQPQEILSDPALEARARAISAGLRCLVCQNQSIDDSNADLAKDLRVLVRERLKAGDSDKQVLEFVVQRYGDYVLLKPPLNVGTLLLWFGPLLMLVGAVFLLRGLFRSKAADGPGTAELSSEEKRRLEALTGRKNS
jgi:cytochrome c-type biogenesis protein CcmH